MAFLFRKKKQKATSIRPVAPVKLDYRAVAITDVGSVRDSNEDHLVFIRPFDTAIRDSHGCLALVADGMGGHSHGEIASQMAADIITRHYFDTNYSVLEALRRAFEKANKSIFQKAVKNPSLKGMGTTCTAVILQQNQLYLGHVGDSRAYLLKGDRTLQLSNDHTLVQHLLDTGRITQEESLSHPQRNIVTRAMGTAAKVKADFALLSLQFEVGDKLLICSDGLYEYIKAPELQAIIQRNKLNEASHALIELAKQRGGHDNISVLIVEAFAADTDQIAKQTQKINLS